MTIRNNEFTELDRDISKTGKSHLDLLSPETGRVYVVAISRDRCPACESQKPRLDRLAKSTAEKHGKKVVFTRIRVKHPTEKDKESLRSKEVLGHYFYPTILILVRTKDKGVIELYRNISPRMSELKRSIETAVKIAERLEKA